MSPGQSIGHYRITTKLGEGGMGQVWRATDTRLGREVAIKIIPAAFAADPDRMARFRREAQVLASLNHPNIAAIYGVEDDALVMELVEGSTLAGPLPADDALPVIHQLIDALEYAHEKGIVHRDLKPANIKVTGDGRVKVLDFGLAKAVGEDAPSGNPESSPTLTMRATLAGVIMGTAGYMAPEQARGHAVDKRADIWAFGVIVFELLSGRRLFDGPTVSDTLAAVLKEEPEWTLLPERLRKLVRACLVRDPRRRMRDIGDTRHLLEEPSTVSASAPACSRLPWAVAALATILGCLAGWFAFRPSPHEIRRVIRFSTTAPVSKVAVHGITFSHDGTRVAFVGGPRSEIYVRALDQLEARVLPGTENAGYLRFSPDDQWISYITARRGSDGHLYKISLAGAPPQLLVDVSAFRDAPGQDWGDDGNIIYASEGTVYRIPASGGKSEVLLTPDAANRGSSFAVPQILPGGDLVLLSQQYSSVVFNVRSHQKKVVFDRGYAEYAPGEAGSDTGHIVYYNRATASLMAVPFDLRRLEVKGAPVRIFDGIAATEGPFGVFGFSSSGSLAFVPGAANNESSFVWIDRTGSEQPIAAPRRFYRGFRLSPEGERVAVSIGESGDYTQRADIWVCDLIRTTLSRITSESHNIAARWTPDGKRVIYAREKGGFTYSEVVWSPADGSSPPQTHQLTEAALQNFPGSVSTDGKLLIGRVHPSPATNRGNALWVLPLAEGLPGGTKPRMFLESASGKNNPEFSPDSHWIAYDSQDTGKREVYVTPYPGPGGQFPVSTGGGTNPRWSHDGRELFYLSGDKVMAVEVQTAPAFHAGIPKILFERNPPPSDYDVAPDGKRFLMLKQDANAQTAPDQLQVVLNWFEELRRLAPVAGR